MWLRKDLKLRAKEAVSRNYWKTVLVSALFSLIFSGGSFFTFKLGDADEIIDDIFYAFPFGIFFMFIAGLLLIAAVILFIIFIVNPLQVGISKFRINAINNLGNISDVGTGYDVSYKRNAETIFMMNLFIFLWSLLFVVPGIVKLYEYSMVPYIIAEDPNISRKDAFLKSKKMMSGNKWRAFVLTLSFIPWYILGALTFGVVTLLYVQPYHQLTSAALYEELKKNSIG